MLFTPKNGSTVKVCHVYGYLSKQAVLSKSARWFGAASSCEGLSAKKKVVRVIEELFPDKAPMLKSDRGIIKVQSMDNWGAIEEQRTNQENILNSKSSERRSVLPSNVNYEKYL